MQEYTIGERKVEKITGETQEESSFILEYILTQQEIQSHQAYGITVVKDKAETDSTGPVSLHKDVVMQLLQKLMDCSITPCVLNEVVDDWFDAMMP